MQLKEMFFLKKRGRKKGEGWGEKEIRAKEAHGNEEGNATKGEKGKERKKKEPRNLVFAWSSSPLLST